MEIDGKMKYEFSGKTIEINTPLNKIWSVFTNSDITRQIDKATFDDATAGWTSALNLVKQIAETL